VQRLIDYLTGTSPAAEYAMARVARRLFPTPLERALEAIRAHQREAVRQFVLFGEVVTQANAAVAELIRKALVS